MFHSILLAWGWRWTWDYTFEESQRRDFLAPLPDMTPKIPPEAWAVLEYALASTSPEVSPCPPGCACGHDAYYRDAPAAQPDAPAVVLGVKGQTPTVFGTPKPKLTAAAHDALQALIDAHPGALTEGELIARSNRPGALNALRKLAKSDPDWKKAIKFPGKNGRGGYAIAARQQRPR